MDPLQFIRVSRFRHHRGFAKDQGWNKVARKWETSNSHDRRKFYGVPVSVVNRFGPHRNGKIRVPGHKNSGSKLNVFLQPRGKPKGNRRPQGTVPVFFHARRVRSRIQIQYWWFFGFNEARAPGSVTGLPTHQGDWEHVRVNLGPGEAEVASVEFAAHGKRKTVRKRDLSLRGANPTRVCVFIARGSHAAYPNVGTTSIDFKGVPVASDIRSNRGTQWDTAANLKPLATQPWRDYAGSWGEVGSWVVRLGSNATTGPLGPWHKRK